MEAFYDSSVRRIFHKQEEQWYFSIVDVCGVLTEQPDYEKSRKYWNKLKQRISEEAGQPVTICHQFKLIAADGKMRLTDCANTEQLFRIIQSIPSKKAEPFKIWLAKVGAERIDETIDPELAMERAVRTYKKKGYTDKWISQRMRSIEIRKELTDEWEKAGITESKDFAFLTNLLTKTWSGKSVREYKDLKGLKKENLRDNMTNTELILNALAEVSTTEISKATNPQGKAGATKATIQGGNIARKAREDL
ncbi:MAG: phage antirepressor protein, partial [Lachnospiraceae bacterium]|nr:phage antirepressor protein [Lachnospiraceae bacterium]